MSFPALGVNRKVVDIDEIYINMRYGTDPIAQIFAKSEKPRFLIKSAYKKNLGFFARNPAL